MKGFNRQNQLFSLCGLNCGLCPMFLNKNCPGCGGGEGNQSCKIARCSMEHNGAQYCFQCSEYPCEKYDHIDDMLMYLGELYQTDERFVEYINRFATWNVAEFFCEAIKVYCCNR